MTSPLEPTYAYHADTFYKRCPSCGKCNEVRVTRQKGHDESEEYWCVSCHAQLGTARANITPAVTVVPDEKCQG